MVSERRRKQRAEKKSRKAAAMKSPGHESAYARKRSGQYPKNSPYLTGNWGQRMKKLRDIPVVEPPAPRPSAELLLARDRAET